MTSIDLVSMIQGFESNDFFTQSKLFFKTLGYDSELHDIDLSSSPNDANFQNFLYMTGFADFFDSPQAKSIESIHLLHQFAHDDLKQQYHIHVDVDDQPISHFEFMAIELNPSIQKINLKLLADITRAINRFYLHPVYILFKFGDKLSFATIDRRMNKINPDQDVLLKVSLIHEISIKNPHTAHLKLLDALGISSIIKTTTFSNFVELHQFIQDNLSAENLNKEFYNKIYKWFELTQTAIYFGNDSADHKALNLIRLLTRLLFVWFIKEKKLIPNAFFDSEQLANELLSSQFDPYSKEQSDYYQAILQNLFFATLNQPIHLRQFAEESNHDHKIALKYLKLFKNQDLFEQYINTIPFMNGGLFECLSDDLFLDNETNRLCIPNFLFFGNKIESFKGLFEIFNEHKFTLTENSSLNQDVALDPELLGLVFENLLASYNPETQMSARKQSGSFYTPREIVDYMVEESLMTYFENYFSRNTVGQPLGWNSLSENDVKEQFQPKGCPILKNKLNQLFKYKINLFDSQQTLFLIKAIDECKIIDPACGSGAFPIGILNKLVELLTILDPNNEEWKNRQLQKIEDMPDSVLKEKFIEDIENSFKNNELDYGRKLYLLENCIYGTDIQPIAIQISKLRCFISLIIDQRANTDLTHNFGIRPLPNLETKFIACNSLIQLTKPQVINVGDTYSMDLVSHEEQDIIQELLQKIAKTRHRLFSEKETSSKIKLREQEKRFRHDLSTHYESLLNKTIKEHKIYVDLKKEVQNTKSQTKKEKLQLELNAFEQNYREENHRNALLIKNWNPADQNAKADFFDAEYMFGISNGFDIVLGNPPYLRIQGLKAVDLKQTEYYKDNYKSATGSYDLYVLFIERGLKLLHDNGILNYICPDKWINASFGKGLRDVIGSNHHLQKLISFKEYQVFNASTYSSLVWISKKSHENSYYFELDRHLTDNQHLSDWLNQLDSVNFSKISNQKLAENTDIWVLTPPNIAKVLERLEQQPKKLSGIFKIFVGLQTSKDTVYFLEDCKSIDDVTISGYSPELDKTIEIEQDLVKPLLKGDMVHRYEWLESTKVVIFPYYIEFDSKKQEDVAKLYTETELKEKFPKGYAYLKQCETVLRNRESKKFDDDEWYRFGRKQGISWGDLPKLVQPDISLGSNFAYDFKGEFYQTTTVYGYIKHQHIVQSYQFFMAILNSKLMWFYLKHTGTVLANGYFRFMPRYVETFPMPDANQLDLIAIKAIETIVDYVLYLKQLPSSKELEMFISCEHLIFHFERLLDAMVFELYFKADLEQHQLRFIDYVYTYCDSIEAIFDPVNSIQDISTEQKEQINQTILKAYHTLNERENEVRNNLIVLEIEFSNTWTLINWE